MIKSKGIPYDIVGAGIMIAKAEDVRYYAKDQFDKCNEWFNKQIVHCVDESEIHRIAATKEIKMNNQKQYTIEILQQAIKICEDYSQETWAIYKGYMENKGYSDFTDSYTEGKSDGAEVCANKLQELLEKIKND